MKRNPEDRLTDSELEQFAAGAGSPAMQSAARELLALRDATRIEVRGGRVAVDDFSTESFERRFVLAKLCERLIHEGYVRPERAAELAERAKNMQAGNGFVTDDHDAFLS